MSRHVFTAEEGQRGRAAGAAAGGRARWTGDDPERCAANFATRRRGGLTRKSQPDWEDHLARCAHLGGVATRARHGAEWYAARLAAWRKERPSRPERFVQRVLRSAGLRPGREFVREWPVTLEDHTVWLDFLVACPDGRRLNLEPGDRRFHGGPAETLDGRDHRAGDAVRDGAVAAALDCTVIRLDADEIRRQPAVVRARILALLAGAAAGDEEPAALAA